MTESNLEESELRHRYERGDYIVPSEMRLAKKRLNKFEKDQKFKESCENASISAAFDASKNARISNIVAAIALVASISSLAWQIFS